MADLLPQLQRGIVVTPNVDHLIHLQHNSDFYTAYDHANFIVCDSQIIRFTSHFLGHTICETITGVDLLAAFCAYHKFNLEIRLFLLGAGKGVAQIAMQHINAKTGREIVVGAYSPSFGFEKDDEECALIVNIINESAANVLVVGVGAPKQEIWIDKYKSAMPDVNLFMGMGAVIDFEAESIPRAPVLLRNIGMEWLFRLVQEPRRLWKRYLIDDIPFFYYVLLQRLGWYRNPFE